MSETSGYLNSALPAAGAGVAGDGRSRGVWRGAWARFRRDRLGQVSMGVVLAYAVMIALTAAGLLAKNWQAEVAVPDARPTFVGPAPQGASAGALHVVGLPSVSA